MPVSVSEAESWTGFLTEELKQANTGVRVWVGWTVPEFCQLL